MGRSNRAAATTSPQRVAAKEKAAEALNCRKLGMTFAMIAETVGYNSPQAAHDAVKRAMKELIREPAEEVLKLELERLDGMWLGSYPNAMQGDPAAIASCLRIMERRAKLLGLDVATKVEAEVTTRELPASVDEFV